MSVYANENDKHAAHWLSCLPIKFDLIDDRSIKDVQGYEVEAFSQCHFFAGIGGWPLALELAKWPIDAPVWTGSCPCQPFSAAGKRKGFNDDRHLWPEFRRLIDECRPATIFGEQVASKAGRDWLATVRTDLEALGYAVGAADLCAASVGAPHIRQRLFWVAHTNGGQSRNRNIQRRGKFRFQSPSCMASSWMANRRCEGLEEWQKQSARQKCPAAERGSDAGRMGDTASLRCEGCQRSSEHIHGSWQASSVEFIHCRDGKARPTKSGVRLLAHGIPGRVAQLRGLGNAIVPQVAAEFIGAFTETEVQS